MKKETLSLDAIKSDLQLVAACNISNMADWRFAYIMPFTALAVMLGVLLKSIIVGVLFFLPAVYHFVLYIPARREFSAQKKALKEALERGDISISVEQLSHIAFERVYEPHLSRRRVREFKEVKFYYFMSGARWRLPLVYKHYEWSREFYLSSEGLENMSVQGNEFYYVSLQGHNEIAYIYPCKIFELHQSLKK